MSGGAAGARRSRAVESSLKRLYEIDHHGTLPPEMVERIRDILALLDVAAEPAHLDRRSLKLHPLKGKRQGLWAVTVRANWRIMVRFEDGDAYDVDFIDDHEENA